MTIDGTISLGNLVVAGSVVSTAIGGYYALKARLGQVEVLLRSIEEDLAFVKKRYFEHQQAIADLNAAVFLHQRRGGMRWNDPKD